MRGTSTTSPSTASNLRRRRPSFATREGLIHDTIRTKSGWSGGAEVAGLLQVIFVVDEDDKVFVIHSRPLTDKEKRKFRKGE